MALTDRLTTAKSELESYLDSVRGAKLEQHQIDRLLTLNGLLGIGASGGATSSVVFTSPQAVTQSGTWNVAVTGESGFLNYRNTALTNTASQIKATAGQTRGWNFINLNSIVVYVKLYDALSTNVVVGTTAVVRTLAVPAGGVFFLEAQSVSQDDFLTAISIACVTGLADSNTTAPTIPIHAAVRYK